MRGIIMKMTTGKRLAVGFGFVTFLMLAAALLAMARLDALSGRLREAASREGPRLQLAHEILGLTNENARASFELFVSSRREPLLQRIERNRHLVTERLADLDTLAGTDEERNLLAEARERRDSYVASFGAVATLLESGREDEALRTMTEETLQRLGRLTETLDRLVAREGEALRSMADEASAKTDRDRALLFAFLLCAYAASTAFALWIIRTVTGPLGGEPAEATKIARRIASGDLDTEIRVAPGDGHSLMAAMGAMQENMRRMVEQLKEDAEQLQSFNSELERRVRERTSQLAASNHELESFSFAVAHDLRTPLRAIEGFSEVLKEDCHEQLDIECRDHAWRIASGARRMGEMIDALMGLTRIARSEIVRHRVDLSALTRSIGDELFMLEPGRRLELLVDDVLAVEADPALLRVVMQNLIGNAWKFTRPRERALIEFGVRKEGGREVFFVRDNGVGFDMQHAARLFAPFQRFHNREQFDGTGIGLATVRRAVRRHGGSIWAEAEPGQGATFFFTLDAEAGPAPNGKGWMAPGLAGA